MSGCEWPRPWSYAEATDVLSRVLKFGMNLSLEPISALCEALGRPQDTFSVVQVTGTNGKSSTARMTAAVLSAHGRVTGLYTSPELERYPERMEVDGAVATDEEFAQAVGVAIDTARALWGETEPGIPAGATEFELLTAAALWHFGQRGVDTAVLEVGMGGRWDATSVVSPAVAVITGVGLDHMHVLGDTLEAIAAEKAAIIRPASAPILGPGTVGLERLFLDRVQEAGTHARAVRAMDTPSPVAEGLTVRFTIQSLPTSPGGLLSLEVSGVHELYADLSLRAPAYQAANVATAVAAAEAALGRALKPTWLRAALAGVPLPGRFELLRDEPPIVVDGSHNPQAAAVLAAAISDAWAESGGHPLVLLGVLSDKDARGIVEALAPAADAFAVATPESPRALPASDLARIVFEVTGVRPLVLDTVAQAAVELAASPSAVVGLVVTGSLTSAGQARAALRDASVTA
ncbi:MAG: bifunctional folylpolyglutamate synthase/dihydrofolate synthase [Actinobacteria bacterium HGW-Actinobacteria-7]|nr:MAG: bifunctional folylpolyglutamate synthase/dihydrofolate synthase [Actinobacteria bacterium HGW-Actinobacteria-7]